MRLLLLFLIIASAITTSYAQDITTRFNEAYQRTDQNFDIDCRYSFNQSFKLMTPLSQTIKGKDYIKRDFLIESETKSATMSFNLQKKDKNFEYTIIFDGKHSSQGNLSRRDFYIPPVNNPQFASEFETSKIYCFVNFAYSAPHVITDGDYHINVHPHKSYDWQSLLKLPVEKYLNDQNYRSLILIETGNYRGNLVNINDVLNGNDYKLPQSNYGGTDLENVPLDVPIIVAPAGHSRYIFKANSELNVTFTGGNHNYCIWNNTRFILESLMRSKSEAKINIYYDTKSLVAQIKGMEKVGINFPKKDINQSNLLNSLLKNQKSRDNYHLNYHYYFKQFFFKEFIGMFKTVKLSYDAEGFRKEDIIHGNGTRELEINLIYLY